MSLPPDLEISESKAKIRASYASIFTALAIPIAIAASTILYNQSQTAIIQRQTCIKESLSLASLIATGVTGSDAVAANGMTERYRLNVAAHAELLVDHCKKFGINLPTVALVTLQQVAQDARTPSVAESAETALNAAQAQSGVSTGGATQQVKPRVYFQISDGNQLGAAEVLASRIRGLTLNGADVLVPGIEIRSRGGDNTLRCFKPEECVIGKMLLADIQSFLAAPSIRLLDLSARYQDATNIRPMHYELWFAPGDISVLPAQ